MFSKGVVQLLVAKEEGTAKMVDGSACKVIDTRTFSVTERERWDDACSRGGSVCPRGTLQSNIIRVLNEEGCRIQVQ